MTNLLRVIEMDVVSDAVTTRLVQLEEQKAALNEAIEAENVRAALFEDEHSIQSYFDKFMHADFDNPKTRNVILRNVIFEYFVDKIYLYDDKLVVTFFYSEDKTEISWGELGDLVLTPPNSIKTALLSGFFVKIIPRYGRERKRLIL